MADGGERRCTEGPSIVLGLYMWGGGVPREASPTPAARAPWAPDRGTDTEFTSSAEISSDWLPRIQAPVPLSLLS